MERVAVVGNSGGGKSTLARAIAKRHGLPYVEIDRHLWRPGWQLVPADEFRAEHAHLIAAERWVMDGLGSLESIPERLSRASEVVLVDMPLWMHFWPAAERQIAWAAGRLAHPPAGADRMPPTEALFRTIWTSTRPGCP